MPRETASPVLEARPVGLSLGTGLAEGLAEGFDSALSYLLALPPHPALHQQSLSKSKGLSPPACAVGFSGGVDSLALLALTKNWAEEQGAPAPVALIVNHSLEKESRTRTESAMILAQSLGVRAKILTPQNPPDSKNEAGLRQLRYGLLEEACEKAKIGFLLLAHQEDDLLETFRLRAGRGSGGLGLAGISAVRDLGTLRLLRPLLGFSRARLEAYVAELSAETGLRAIDDPSNAAVRGTTKNNERVRQRIALARLPAKTRLDLREQEQRAVAQAGQARAQAESLAQALFTRTTKISPWGFATLEPNSALLNAPLDTLALLLRGLILALSGNRAGNKAHPPTLDALRPLAELILAPSANRPTSIGGHRLILPTKEGGSLFLAREARGLVPAQLRAGRQIWDGRFVITLDGADQYIFVAPYTGTAKALRKTLCQDFPQEKFACLQEAHLVPKSVLASLPVLLGKDDSGCDPRLLCETLLLLGGDKSADKNETTKIRTKIRFVPNPPPFSVPFVPFYTLTGACELKNFSQNSA